MELMLIIAGGILLAFVVIKMFSALGRACNKAWEKPNWGAMIFFALLFAGFLYLWINKPAKAASDDIISNIRFGAAITSVFNNNCRPVNGQAFALAAQVLSGMPDDQRFRLLRQARTLLDQSNKQTFCGMFEENIKIMEDAQ